MGKAVESPKGKIVSVRLTDFENDLLEQEAKRRKMNVSDLLREKIHESWVGPICDCKLMAEVG